MCDGSGHRNVKSEMDTVYGVLHECTHDRIFEKQFEDHRLNNSSELQNDETNR